MHLKLDLADDTRPVAHGDHLVIFLHVEGGNFHRKNVNPLLGAPFHLREMLIVGRSDDYRLNIGMVLVHLVGIEVAGNSGLIEFISLLRIFILRTARHPVQFRVVAEDLIIFSRMTVGQTHHCDLQRFHIGKLPFFQRKMTFFCSSDASAAPAAVIMVAYAAFQTSNRLVSASAANAARIVQISS